MPRPLRGHCSLSTASVCQGYLSPPQFSSAISQTLLLAPLLDFNQQQSACLLLSHPRGGNEYPGSSRPVQEGEPHCGNGNELLLLESSWLYQKRSTEEGQKQMLRGKLRSRKDTSRET